MDPRLSPSILGDSRAAAIEPPSTVRRAIHAAIITAVLTLILAPSAQAAGTGTPMPWDGPLTALLDNLGGPTARILVTLAGVAAGLM